MSIMHNVEIAWDELLDAFSGSEPGRVYFLDKTTGEVFFIPANLDDEDVWRQMENNAERFVEIPSLDISLENQIMLRFAAQVEDIELKPLLEGLLNGARPYGNIAEILSFFPEELERLQEMRDEFLASRVRQWLELNNLFTYETDALHIHRS